MKKTNKIIVALIMIAAMLASSFTALYGTSKADEYEDIVDLYVYSESMYEFQPAEILDIYADLQTSHPDLKYRYAHDVSKGTLIPILVGEHYGTQLQDGKIDATDSTCILAYTRITSRPEALDGVTAASENSEWMEDINDIRRSIVKYYEKEGKTVNLEDIKVTVTVVTPAVEELDIAAGTYDYVMDTDTGITQAVFEKICAVADINQRGQSKQNSLQKVTLTAETKDGKLYKMVVGSDNNFYLLDPESINVVDFGTTMSYTALDKTTEDDGNVFLPPYIDNDNPNKDADVTVTIKSKTGENIIAVVSGETAAELSKDANELGWYYPDEADKTVIAKVYPFDKYDNKTFNGKVSETVKLISENEKEDTQNPKIDWTFRRKTKDETQNADGSITIVITYNLPVDKDSIPSDWEPIYDEDGETIHKITKTIKKGENYKKDVTVKQNGTDATVTTPVEKVWELPKTGDIWTFAAIGMVILVVFTISRRRKIK